MDETYWKKNATTKQICEEKRNTIYFHALVNKKRATNHIQKIKIMNGSWCEDYKELVYYGIHPF